MKKALPYIVAATLLLVGCNPGPMVTVDALVGKKDEQGNVRIRYANISKEVSFFDVGFDGTLDYVIENSGQLRRIVTRDSSDFPKYDSMYHSVRQMATTGEVK
jgi:hypothetical protein